MTFSIASTPELNFGVGKISILPSVISSFGSKVLLVTGAKSFQSSTSYAQLVSQFELNGISFKETSIVSEPSPAMIDNAVGKFSSYNPDVVVAVGGGSAIDAGKAISAMLPLKDNVKHYLESVGTKNHPGTKIPFIAIPTTAGTGSEATKNAVISEVGEQGFKRSLRHNKFVPDVAIVDPGLMINCPSSITASSGMDAFTQLLESYVSTKSTPVTDALALEGLRGISQSLLKAFHEGTNVIARTDMALAAYLSGITLANAGLGLVHGFASSVGGYFDIPHGVICSSLMSAANKVTVRKLRNTNRNEDALMKYSIAGKVFSHIENKSREYYTDFLLDMIESWRTEMKIPALAQYGVSHHQYREIVDVTDNKNNPIALDNDEMIEVLEISN